MLAHPVSCRGIRDQVRFGSISDRPWPSA